MRKKVLSENELKIEKILQQVLPEYVIRANMRLADVIHVRKEEFKYKGGYHLDFVVCDQEANTIAVIELDDSTHDTEDGKRRDANKNKWLAEVRIKLIRIRTEEEARNIRSAIFREENNETKRWQSPKTYRRTTAYKARPKAAKALPAKHNFNPQEVSNAVDAIKAVKSMALVVFFGWLIVSLGGKAIEKMQRNKAEKSEQIQREAKLQALEAELAQKEKNLRTQQQLNTERGSYPVAESAIPPTPQQPSVTTQAPSIPKSALPLKAKVIAEQKPKECESPKTEKQFVECVNIGIRNRNGNF